MLVGFTGLDGWLRRFGCMTWLTCGFSNLFGWFDCVVSSVGLVGMAGLVGFAGAVGCVCLVSFLGLLELAGSIGLFVLVM